VNEEIQIWTDGGCLGNPGPGGWAFVVRFEGHSEERSGFDANTTNNRMELTAVRQALQMVSAQPPMKGRPIIVHTDSQYVQKGITQWIHTWARNGWKTSSKKPVKNSELWLTLWDLSRALPVSWIWVMGHAGDEMNERCDGLVQMAISRGLKAAP
jgi:ribonuclease HI